MQVIIAEKPSVARSIAAIVGANKQEDGYLEGNGYTVTWAFGHLITLPMPEEYGFQSFKAENLPFLPKPFRLKPKQVKDGKKYKNDPGVMKQLETIGMLFDSAERIIVATDAGREGCLIFRYIYSYLKCTTPFDRLWISSLTDKAIREGLQNLRPGRDYDNLYLSAKARSEADWLVGINASQALAITAGRGIWSLGRVQTPTLAIICSRYLENKSFQPETYYQLKLSTGKDEMTFSALSVEKYTNRTLLDEAFSSVQSSQTILVKNVECKEVSEEPPLLYDLTTLQKEANTKHSFSADKTLSIAQALYEKKVLTYPRTGSRYISADVMDEMPELIGKLKDYTRFSAYATNMDNEVLNIRVVDDKKVTDHHAIIITENLPDHLSPEERIIYEMVAGRMLESFSKRCKKEKTTISLEVGGVEFAAQGSRILSSGWRGVFGIIEDDNDADNSALPKIENNDLLPLNSLEKLEKQTKPRPIHTESSLLSAMETCAKDLENEEEREAMKESGIGTPATRAAIIETLFAREYIRREKKSLIPTEKGLAVYEIVKDKRIADVAMTGGWELALSKITTGEMDAYTFHEGIEIYATQITAELLSTKIENKSHVSGAVCPKCGAEIIFYPKVAKCRNARCGLMVFRTIAQKDLSDSDLKELISGGRTSLIKGFIARSGNKFDAYVSLDKDFKTAFEFPQKKKSGVKNRRK